MQRYWIIILRRINHVSYLMQFGNIAGLNDKIVEF